MARQGARRRPETAKSLAAMLLGSAGGSRRTAAQRAASTRNITAWNKRARARTKATT